MRIETLTEEQAARFGEWTQKWVEIGLSTEPADFDRATAAALKASRALRCVRGMGGGR